MFSLIEFTTGKDVIHVSAQNNRRMTNKNSLEDIMLTPPLAASPSAQVLISMVFFLFVGRWLTSQFFFVPGVDGILGFGLPDTAVASLRTPLFFALSDKNRGYDRANDHILAHRQFTVLANNDRGLGYQMHQIFLKVLLQRSCNWVVMIQIVVANP